MTTGPLHTGKTDPITLLFVFSVIVLAVIAGRNFIAWLLMKLYEVFIQQNSLRL